MILPSAWGEEKGRRGLSIVFRKSGVSPSFLPEKTNRHRITRAASEVVVGRSLMGRVVDTRGVSVVPALLALSRTGGDTSALGRRLSTRNLGFLGPGRERGLDLLEPGQDRGLVVATDRVEKLPQGLATGREGWGFRVREVIAEVSPVPDEVEVGRLAFDEGDQAGEGTAGLGVLMGGDVADDGERPQGRLGDGVVADALRLREPVDLLETRRETAQTDLNLKRGAQVVLGRGPVLGQVVAGADGEGLAVSLHRLAQPPQTLRPPNRSPRPQTPRLFWVWPSWGRSSRV